MADKYNNSSVLAASNPTKYGYHYGPIPNPNPNWVPPELAILKAGGKRNPQITTGMNANPPNAASTMSRLNSGICDIDVNGGQMCGQIIEAQIGLRRHIRQAHPGALTNVPRGKGSLITQAEKIAGENALRAFILIGGWRKARYLNEPGPGSGLIARYATELEEIAATDLEFARVWGSKFHRENAFQQRQTWRKRKRRMLAPLLPISETPDEDIESGKRVKDVEEEWFSAQE